MIERWVLRWQALAARERAMLVAATVFVGLALLWALAFEPAWTGRQKLAAELPTLRAKLARVESLAAEAGQLSNVAGSTASPQELRTQLERSLATAGLSARVQSINVSGDLIELRLKAVPFPSLAFWLDAALRETRMRVVDVSITREATGAGAVTARIALEAPRGEAGR